MPIDNFHYFEFKGATYFIEKGTKAKIDELIDSNYELFRFFPDVFRKMFYIEGLNKLQNFIGGASCRKDF